MIKNLQIKKHSIWIILFLLFIGIGTVLLIPISYYTLKPGVVLDVRPLVHVEGEKHPKGGSFLLTSVSLKEGTVFDYLASRLTKNMELIQMDKMLAIDESAEQYERRQQKNMLSSQQCAIIASYRYAKKTVDVHNDGVEVFQVKRDRCKLKQGDLIQKIDKTVISSSEELSIYLKGKTVGEFVNVAFLRNKERMNRQVELVALSGKNPKAGLGIIPITRIHLTAKPLVRISAEDISGPSAGLMFALEVLNQLLPEDLTNGHDIAGTGTISPEGKVGQIGGIKQKVLAADKEGVSFFLCPKDLEPGDENEKQAKAKIKELNSTMKIVPVASLKEAVYYLRTIKKTP